MVGTPTLRFLNSLASSGYTPTPETVVFRGVILDGSRTDRGEVATASISAAIQSISRTILRKTSEPLS